MDETNVGITVGDANLTQFVSALALAVNSTYSFASGSSMFCAVVPSYMKDYAYRYVMPACRWLDGHVPEIHDGTSGIMSTRIANRLITGVTKQVVGEKLLFNVADAADGTGAETLKKITEWAEQSDAIRAVYAAVGFAIAVGTSIIKANTTSDGRIWWEAVRLDNSFFVTDFRGEVKEATFCIRPYSDTRKDKSSQQFFLTERRFYRIEEQGAIQKNEDGTYSAAKVKGKRIPMVEYCVYRTNGQSLSNMMPSAIGNKTVPWAELPKVIKEAINRDYSAVMVGKPQRLGFPNLGVEILRNGHIDLGVPTGQFGESLIVGCQSDFITYEYAYACRIRDMYLGKGTVYQPKQMSMSDISGLGGGAVASHGTLSAMPESPIEIMRGADPDSQKAIVQQFALRAEEWQRIMDDSLKAIATKWGMSPKILSSYLANGSAQQTATQIDSEDDQSIAFINLTRSYFSAALNRLLETTLNYMGRPDNVTVAFSSPSVVNKDRIIDRAIKLMDSGLIDVEQAVRDVNPDAPEDAIQAKIAKAKEAKAEMMSQQAESFGSLLGGSEPLDEDGTGEPDGQ